MITFSDTYITVLHVFEVSLMEAIKEMHDKKWHLNSINRKFSLGIKSTNYINYIIRSPYNITPIPISI